ncbi:DUF1232 domain-containing protein [Luteipulveratus sp. YIM 133132]|uniref:DUF1232 domain-containing protein n=1 Tax=Luteipulveratus flavus TaxID=3031728 RepID=A0ABT6CBA9_9MICO|nr:MULTISPECIES: DUF1232 domain-containing protein [unclassified Luteipulveratus]MDE9365436.1 DUF1232 domain-containing protein [Luteipulveratus sp. YIM 133132]MDF8266176.1 DUF1232 domain-containing protein [Luteipulveratus sp. YIM 133296]
MGRENEGVARLLTSPSFTRCRAAAGRLADDREGLRRLMDQVDGVTFGAAEPLDDRHGRVDVDIACSVVEARLEELDEGDAAPLAELEPTASARLRLILAALLYLVLEEDAVPDHHRLGHLDDLAIVHWVTQIARGELPAVRDNGHGPVAQPPMHHTPLTSPPAPA